MASSRVVPVLGFACVFELFLCLGCSDPGRPSPPDADGGVTADANADGDTDASVEDDADLDSSDDAIDATEADIEENDGSSPSNEALVFEVDPVSTPTPTRVELQWVADDVGGGLTSAPDRNGLRLLKAWTCVDEGDSNFAPGIGEQRICTLRQLANKELNGSFVYDDWTEDAACRADPVNVHAEVNLYYHAQKIYDLITAPEVGVFDRLPGRHEVAGTPVPLNLVANYRAPMPIEMGDELMPARTAFFLPRETLRRGMSTFAGLEGLEGDVIVFGQGPQADFGYSGETVYHEFGHVVTHATAELEMISVDEQGLTNLPRALDEGLANTFAFLGSEQSLLHQYIVECLSVPGFDATNDDRFPDDLRGHPVADGNSVLAANWEIYRAMLDQWGGSRSDFIRVLLETLIDLPRPLSGDAFSVYASTFLGALADDGWTAQVSEASAVFESRGLFGVARAVDITSWDGTVPNTIFAYGASLEPWNTVITLDQPEGEIPVSTAYFQWVITVPDGSDTLVLSARLGDMPGSTTTPGLWDYQIFLRHGEPVRYEIFEGTRATVAADEALTPTLEPDSGSLVATWTFEDLTPKTTLYLHLVNFGISEGTLRHIECDFR